ncbi:MAG: MFS transporter [Roseiflexaceae bacterium]|nr:MFS transporter [Roseiflexaceae bacterium]
MWGGFFMVVPLISVHYVDSLGWSAAAIGLVLAVRQLTQQGLTLFGGMLADQIGARGLIVVGLAIRVLAFSLMAQAGSYGLLMASAVLAAIGGALFDSPKAAAIAALTVPETRSRYYAMLGVASSLGMTAGPLLGALLLNTDFALVAYVAAGCFAVCLVVSLFLLPAVRVAKVEGDITAGLRLAAHDTPFLRFTALMMGYWFMWVQLSISLPLVAKSISGTSDAVGWLYALNAGMSVLLQYPLLRLAERRLRHEQILVAGIGAMALGLGAIALAHTVATLLVCVAIFSIGSLLVAPTQQTVTAGLANPAALGSYFGVASLALALGGGFGNFVGGWLIELAAAINVPALPWLVFCAVGLLAAAGLGLLDARRQAALLMA